MTNIINYVSNASDIEIIHKLDRVIFNDGSCLVEDLGGYQHYWLMTNHAGNVMGYMVAEECEDNIILGTRSAIVEEYRGHGLQKELIKAREAFFGPGYTHCTYIQVENVASINTFIKLGYTAYVPQEKYGGGDDKIYMMKVIKDTVVETCKYCGSKWNRIPKCSDCVHLEYYSVPDGYLCNKGKTGTRLCKDFDSIM